MHVAHVARGAFATNTTTATALCFGLSLDTASAMRTAPGVCVRPPQGLYTVQAAGALTTVTASLQEKAFAALGLPFASYHTLMFPMFPAALHNGTGAGQGTASPSPSLSPSAALNSSNGTGNSSSVQPVVVPFDLTQPLMAAVIAANAQIVGLMYTARCDQCYSMCMCMEG